MSMDEPGAGRHDPGSSVCTGTDMSDPFRRGFLRTMVLGGAALGGGLAEVSRARPAPAPTPGALRSMTAHVKPITADERRARLDKLQSLMRERKITALLVESGSSLDYFTGVKWWRSERTTAALLPAQGQTVIVTPYFEEPSIRETLQVGADVRTWKEDESPFDLLAGAAREHGESGGVLAVEPTTRFFIWDRVGRALNGARELASGEMLVNACRMHKSPAELALMQAANQATLAGIRHVHGRIEAGMSALDINTLLVDALTRLGVEADPALVLLNEASAFPHGSTKPQVVRPGSTILIDSTSQLHGLQADMSRTWFFGEPGKRQRELWNTVKRGQEIALQTARVGVPVGEIDRAVRGYYEGLCWSRDYRLPGLSHRTGHGIGMDGHEAPYLVRNDRTPLEPGMCFSDEPGLYVPGEFGVRLEDCWTMTETGPKTFTPLAKSVEEPV